MDTFYSVDEAAHHMAKGAITIGNFDGVHVGHQALINQTIALKGEHKSGVLTFSPHPQEILAATPPRYITTDQEKISLFSRYGLDIAIIQPVGQQFLKLSPAHFVESMLVRTLRVKHVVVGHDFTFGEKAAGDVKQLTTLGERYGFTTHVIPPVLVHNERCSSSAIRRFLVNGAVLEANAMLGRHYSVRGTVIVGNQLGGRLGFHTANLRPYAGFLLRNGVYATFTRVYEHHGHTDYVSATNVGVRPTVISDGEVLVESHILDERLDLYGKTIEVFFVAQIRDEEKFNSLTSLQEQVQKDCLVIRQMYHEHPQLFQPAN